MARTRRDDGFSLIELLVALIVIGILAAIALPVFLHQRNAASRAASESLMRALGMQAFMAIVESLPGDDITAAVGAEAGRWRMGTHPVLVDQGAGAVSTDDHHVAALLEEGDEVTWVGSVLAEGGTCLRVVASSLYGLSTVDAAEGGDCTPVPGAAVAARAPAGLTTVTLSAADFAARLLNPNNGNTGKPVVWADETVRLDNAGVLLSNATGLALQDLVFGGTVTLADSARGVGLVFRASQGTGGLSGYVFQVDPTHRTDGQPSLILRQWTDGDESRQPLGRIPIPAGMDPYGANQLRVTVIGDQFVGSLNGQEVMRVTLPSDGPQGSQYGARTWGSGGATVSGLTVTATS